MKMKRSVNYTEKVEGVRRFLAILTDFNNYHSRMPMRMFLHADAARNWVSQIHSLMCDDADKGISDDYLESAELYRITRDGRCLKIDEFSGLDRGDGLAGGWERECQWLHAKGYGCSRSQMKGKMVCAYHARDSKYRAPEEGFWVGSYDTYKSKRARIAQLRADLKDSKRPDLSQTLLSLVNKNRDAA